MSDKPRNELEWLQEQIPTPGMPKSDNATRGFAPPARKWDEVECRHCKDRKKRRGLSGAWEACPACC